MSGPPLVAVLGAGRLGRGVALMLQRSGARVRVWARRELSRKQVQQDLGGIETAASVAEAAEGASLFFFAVPAPAMPEVAKAYGEVARGDHICLHACRGVADGFVLPHVALRRESCVRKIGALGGPLYLEDLEADRPLACVVASRYDEVVELTRALVQGTPVRVHASRDVVGVEVAGALSNVAMIAAGMAEALDLGETARGVLLTHGLSEAERLGCALGGELATFSGLAGVGDLIPRRVSSTLRNETVGRLLAEGRPLEEALAQVQGIVEGVVTARETLRLADSRDLELPLVRAICDVMEGRRPARAAVEDVLARDLALGREALAL